MNKLNVVSKEDKKVEKEILRAVSTLQHLRKTGYRYITEVDSFGKERWVRIPFDERGWLSGYEKDFKEDILKIAGSSPT